MTDQLTERLRAAADDAMHEVRLDDPRTAGVAPPLAPITSVAGSASSSRRDRGGRRWLTATAAAAAAAVIGGFFWLNAGSAPDPVEPAPPAPETPSGPRERLVEAVEATRSAPAWSAEVTGGVGETVWVFESPDRIEMKTAGSNGEWVSSSVTVGSDMYVLDDGQWVLLRQDWRTAAPLNLLDALERVECAARESGAIVYWVPSSGGCGAAAGRLPEDLPLASEVGRVELDGSGRIQAVRSAEILELDGQGVVRPDPDSDDVLARLGAVGGVIATFRYDDVPPVTVPVTSGG